MKMFRSCIYALSNRMRTLSMQVDLMFSNCIKFNNEGPDQSNLYRTEAKRQRRKFGDLYKDALHQLQKRMDVAMKVDRS